MWIQLRELSGTHESLANAGGRALAVCQHLESTCRFVLTIVEMGHAHQVNPSIDLDALQPLTERVRKKLLGGMVDRFDQIGNISYDHLQVLERGREARNFFAHEALSGISEVPLQGARLFEACTHFANRVQALVEADDLASAWSYGIQEKDSLSASARSARREALSDWILEPLRDILGAT